MKKFLFVFSFILCSFFGYAQVNSFPYTEDFETGAPGWEMQTTLDSLWEIGTPTTTNFSNDNTPCIGNAAVTSLMGNYPSNADAKLYSPFFNFTTFTSDPTLQFSINRYLENCCDEIWVEMSLDSGATWTKVLGPGTNWYNDLGNQWWDNNTNGWQAVSVTLTGASSQNNVQLRFVLSSDGSAADEGVGIDNIYVGATGLVDLELVEILTPVSGCGLSSTEAITIVIRNNSSITAAFTDYAICYNGAIPQACETTITNILGNTMDTITLLGTADLSAVGSHTINFYLSMLSPDFSPCNDSLVLTVINVPTIASFPYFQDFEGTSYWTVNNGINGTWELATPANTVINSAASGVNAWVTNASGNYNPNDNSWVTSPCFDFSSFTCAPTVEMDIWWESEFSWDGAVLQSSIDGGTSWQNVGAITHPNNWYTDNTINGSPGGQQEGWTGRNGSGSNGWVTASHSLDGLAGQSSVKLRTAFASDGSVSDEGFAFDNVRIHDGLMFLDNMYPDDFTLCEGDSIQLSGIGDGNGNSIYSWSTADTTQMIWAFTGGDYILTRMDSTGCSFTDTATIIEIALPTPYLGVDTLGCAGTIMLDAGTAASYLWSTGETTQTINVAISDTIWVAATNIGCATINDTIVIDTIYANPVIDLGLDTTACDWLNLDAGAGYSIYTWSSGGSAQMDSIMSTGAYTIIVEDVNGCMGMDSIMVTIETTPMLMLGADTSACDGATITIDAGTADSYMWSNSATTQTIPVTTSGTYSVTATNAGLCADSDDIMVTFNTNPTVTLGNDITVCEGDSVSLDAGAGNTTYNWSTGSTTQIEVVTTSGTYTVTVTNANGCEGTDDIMVTIDSCLNVTSFSANDVATVNIFPNPSKGSFNISIEGSELVNLSIDIMDITGRIIFLKEVGTVPNSYLQEVQLENLPTGIYMVRVTTTSGTTTSGTITKKIVIQE
jgi:hypothetical protein